MHRIINWTAAALFLISGAGCSIPRPARDALMNLATDYRISSRSQQGITIDYDPVSIDRASLEPIAQREARRYGKTARPGALLVARRPRMNQQHFEFVELER